MAEAAGYSVIIRDPFRAYTISGERPDAIGWRDGISILIECKASRADFLADRKNPSMLKPTINRAWEIGGSISARRK